MPPAAVVANPPMSNARSRVLAQGVPKPDDVPATVVSARAALVSGAGRTDAVGLGWAAVVLGCEAAFTLLAVPVLGRLGPWAVSLHAVWLAAVALVLPVLVLGGDVTGLGPVAALVALTTLVLVLVLGLASARATWAGGHPRPLPGPPTGPDGDSGPKTPRAS